MSEADNAIAAAMKAANEANQKSTAEASATKSEVLPVTQSNIQSNIQNNTTVTANGAGGTMSLFEGMQRTVLTSDYYIKAKSGRIMIGKTGAGHKTVKLDILMSNVTPMYMISVTNPTTKQAVYYRCKDPKQLVSVEGRPWADCLREAKQLDPSNRSDPFLTYDVRDMRLSEQLMDEGQVEYPAGTSVGFTPSFKAVKAFYNLLQEVEKRVGRDKMLSAVAKVEAIPESIVQGTREYSIISEWKLLDVITAD